MTATGLKALLVVLLAGREAERQMLGADQMSTGATSDLSRASELAYHAIADCGLDPELGPVAVNVNRSLSNQFSGLVAERLRHWLGDAEVQCKELLAEHSAKLKAVAELLYEEESLEGRRFLEVVGD